VAKNAKPASNVRFENVIVVVLPLPCGEVQPIPSQISSAIAKLDFTLCTGHLHVMPFEVAAFYKFAKNPEFCTQQQSLLTALKSQGVKGSILLAEEGINGTIAAASLAGVMVSIERLTGISAIECKFSSTAEMPFKRMKVRLKKEIVTIGNVKANPTDKVGTYVEPQDWNALISDPDVLVIDTRNAYEFAVGTFQGAIDPKTESFSEFPNFVRTELPDRKPSKIAMFCTGGIRCEKASSFMKYEGYENVYHLKGGILKYLELIPRNESLWQGECFVFDERVAVTHGLAQGTHTICHGCLQPVSAEDRASALFEDGVSCPRCAASLTDEQRNSNRERQKQFLLANKRGLRHLGPTEG
jgi:UPF0176 protein